jgi:cold shock protein
MSEGKRIRGIVQWFNNSKGYGFIKGADGEDVFVHYSSIQIEGFRSLNEGEEVEYERVKGEKGWQGINVVRVSQGASA